MQHKIVEAGASVAKHLLKVNRYFYVCGSVRQVPDDIYAATKFVIMASEVCGEEDAEAALSNMKIEGRCTVEAWS